MESSFLVRRSSVPPPSSNQRYVIKYWHGKLILSHPEQAVGLPEVLRRVGLMRASGLQCWFQRV